MINCEISHITGKYCLREAEIYLPIAISAREGSSHAFCEYHAGLLVGMAAAALAPDDRDRGDEDGRPVKRV